MTQTDPTIRDPKQRLTRRCDLCGQIDDHPHIILFHADGTSQSGHHDCAAAEGHAEAREIVAAAEGKQGDELTRFLTRGGADHLATPSGELETYVLEQEVN